MTDDSDRTGSGRLAASSGVGGEAACGVTGSGNVGRAATGWGAAGWLAGDFAASTGESSRIGDGLAGRVAIRSVASGVGRESLLLSLSRSRSFREAAEALGLSKVVVVRGVCAAICAGTGLALLAIAVVASSRS